VNNTVTQSFTNNGATFNALVTTPSNSGETGHVKGLEVGYQQTYSFLPGILGGLGFSGNFTYIDSSGVPQASPDATDPNVVSGLISTVDTSRLPLQGLSKYAFNVSPFWNYKGIEARAAYAFRSQYLLTVRDVIVPYAPILSADYGQLDASIFYQVTPNLRMGFQGVNLTNSQTETKQVITDTIIRPRQWFINDRRFTFSARFRFGS
jgi:TonB-dependent receptor